MITTESGRSLIETLGMLAIMGILSVVGMAGYNAAMDKNRANTIINEAQKRAVIIAGQIGFNGNSPSLAEFSPYDNGMFDSSHVYYKEDGLTGQFGIKVLNVKKSVCQNILNTIGDKTPIRRLSKTDALTTPITSCDDEEDYVIIYNEGMKGDGDTEYCSADKTCTNACAECVNGSCVGECEVPKNSCDVNDDCNQKNECMICDTDTHTCKDGCRQVAYLQSDGNQYIDTRYIVGQDDTITFRTEVGQLSPEVNYLCGASSSWKNNFNFSVRGNASNYINGWFGYDEVQPESGIFAYKGDEFVLSASKNGVIINGIKTNRTVGTQFLDATTLIFTKHNSPTQVNAHFYQGKMYYFKIWHNSNLIYNFVPVHANFRPAGQKNCMLNKVPDETGKLKLYCSETGTDFIIP